MAAAGVQVNFILNKNNFYKILIYITVGRSSSNRYFGKKANLLGDSLVEQTKYK